MPADPTAAVVTRRVLVVLGMHRGGTSAVAGMLHRLGVDFGPRLMPANADNPAGYYEHNDVVNLHDRFLGRLDAAWDAPFPPEFDPHGWPGLAPSPGLPTYREELLAILRRDFPGGPDPAAAPWGLKDPRLCLLLPWWQPLWTVLSSEPLFVIVLRSPGPVAASLERRDGFSAAKSNLLWLQHLLRAERDTRGQRRCFVDYDRFLGDWRRAVGEIAQTFGLSWPTPPDTLPPDAAGFPDPALRHHLPSQPPEAPPAGQPTFPWVEEVRATLSAAGPGDPATLDAIYAQVMAAGQVATALQGHRKADVEVEVQAQRRLTRWYEEEWQKTREQVNELRRKLSLRDKKIHKFQERSSSP